MGITVEQSYGIPEDIQPGFSCGKFLDEQNGIGVTKPVNGAILVYLNCQNRKTILKIGRFCNIPG